MKKPIFSLCVVLFLLVFCTVVYPGEIIEKPEYMLYVPARLDPFRHYPFVIALSPVADAASMINLWMPVADEYKWIVFASKEVKNGQPFYSDVDYRVMKLVKDLCAEYPIDSDKIIATGLSGGGQAAHAYSYIFPEVVSAVVVNTGKINEYFLEPGRKEKYPVKKFAVFLASPEDFRYQEMQRDRDFLQMMGWRTKWIEFQGGHQLAPTAAYKEAAQWLTEQF